MSVVETSRGTEYGWWCWSWMSRPSSSIRRFCSNGRQAHLRPLTGPIGSGLSSRFGCPAHCQGLLLAAPLPCRAGGELFQVPAARHPAASGGLSTATLPQPKSTPTLTVARSPWLAQRQQPPAALPRGGSRPMERPAPKPTAQTDTMHPWKRSRTTQGTATSSGPTPRNRIGRGGSPSSRPILR